MVDRHRCLLAKVHKSNEIDKKHDKNDRKHTHGWAVGATKRL